MKINKTKWWLPPLIATSLLISCNNVYVKPVIVNFPGLKTDLSNNVTTRNMRDVNANITQRNKNELIVIIKEKNNNFNLEEAIELVKKYYTFSGFIQINHISHSHEQYINNLLENKIWGIFDFSLIVDENNKFFQINNDTVNILFKLASNNNMFSYSSL